MLFVCLYGKGYYYFGHNHDKLHDSPCNWCKNSNRYFLFLFLIQVLNMSNDISGYILKNVWCMILLLLLWLCFLFNSLSFIVSYIYKFFVKGFRNNIDVIILVKHLLHINVSKGIRWDDHDVWFFRRWAQTASNNHARQMTTPDKWPVHTRQMTSVNTFTQKCLQTWTGVHKLALVCMLLQRVRITKIQRFIE